MMINTRISKRCEGVRSLRTGSQDGLQSRLNARFFKAGPECGELTG